MPEWLIPRGIAGALSSHAYRGERQPHGVRALSNYWCPHALCSRALKQVSRNSQRAILTPSFVLERQFDLGAIGFHLAVLELQILLDHFSNAQISHRLRRAIHGCLCSLFPRFGAG